MTMAALCGGIGRQCKVEELDLDPPWTREMLIRGVLVLGEGSASAAQGTGA